MQSGIMTPDTAERKPPQTRLKSGTPSLPASETEHMYAADMRKTQPIISAAPRLSGFAESVLRRLSAGSLRRNKKMTEPARKAGYTLIEASVGTDSRGSTRVLVLLNMTQNPRRKTPSAIKSEFT